jgi:hypothetical protein
MVRAMCHYNDKEMLVVPYNTGNHWLLLSISTMYEEVWYCDSASALQIQILASDLPMITLMSCLSLTSKFVLHVSF